MDAETYLAERMMRDRIADVRASAELARLLRQSTERSPRYSLGTRLFETRRSLVKTARRLAFAISRALGNENARREAPVGTRRSKWRHVMTTTIHSMPTTALVTLERALDDFSKARSCRPCSGLRRRTS